MIRINQIPYSVLTFAVIRLFSLLGSPSQSLASGQGYSWLDSCCSPSICIWVGSVCRGFGRNFSL